MKNLRIVSAAILLAAGAVLALGSCAREGGDGEIVAKVNGSPIYASTLDMEMVRYGQGLAESEGGPESEGSQEAGSLEGVRLARLRAEALERLIGTELLYQEAVRAGYRATDQAVDEQMNALMAGFESADKFEEALASLKIRREDLRRDLEHGLSIEAFVDREIGPTVSVSPQDARAYYDSHLELFTQPERVHARHILIQAPQESGSGEADEARATLRELRRRVAAGEDFGALAQQYSQGPSAPQGGDLGYFGRGDMVEPFEEAAFALGVGEVSDIVVTPFGYHLIQLLDRTAPAPVDFDAVGAQLVRYLQEQRVAQAVADLTGELRAKADVSLSEAAQGE